MTCVRFFIYFSLPEIWAKIIANGYASPMAIIHDNMEAGPANLAATSGTTKIPTPTTVVK